jgi:hypothetical protein
MPRTNKRLLGGEDRDRLGQQAYEAYGAVVDFKNFAGDPMPKWLDLPTKIQAAWRAAAVDLYRMGHDDMRESVLEDLDSRLPKIVGDRP